MTSPQPIGASIPKKAISELIALLCPLLVSLFFLEALRLYFAQVYLIVWAALFSDPVDLAGLAVAMLMLLSLFAPLLVPILRRLTDVGTLALASTIGISLIRLLLSADLPFEAETTASCVIIALYGIFVPAYLEKHHQATVSNAGRGYLAGGFALALSYDMAIRALGGSLALSLSGRWFPVQLILSTLALVSAWASQRRTERNDRSSDLKRLPSWAGVLVLSGLGPLLFLEYNLFMHASTVSRWVHVNYDLMALLLPGATAVALLLPRSMALESRRSVAIQNVLILISVAAFLWYDGWLSVMLILVGQVCVVLDLRLLFRFGSTHVFRWRTSTVVGAALTLGLLSMFILTFVLTLSFAYAYTLEMFRGTEPLSFLIAVLLGATSSGAAWTLSRVASARHEVSWVKLSVAALPALLALVGLALQPAIDPQPAELNSLTLMTYNIHQSFGMDNKLDVAEIASTIRRADPDIVGLQEADAGRVPSLSVDQVLFLSHEVSMHSAYGPSWADTYGVAVLSKYPIVQQRRYLLSSAEQQRACLEATIELGDQTLTFFSVHLGLNSQERERQLDELLAYTAAAPAPKVLVGDFNANPGSHEISRVLEQFQNAFAVAGVGDGYTSPANSPEETIDYVFVSPDISVLSAEVIPSLASDHLPVAARIRLPPH